ncbi:MAG TPA: methyltransferase domain-containing protein [Bradyrhizobium sp.]|nr:methyltransferase domain-containing protein [Bradyrhizobium sp.]
MTNEFRTLKSHSAEYFGDTRDYWWNQDYIELIGRRFGFDHIHDVLDVGCGVGHWAQLLASALPADAHVLGVDRDPLWISKATERAAAKGISDRFQYRVSDAHTLPFPDASFDLVTCQTVLIHVADPAAVIAEMARVTRPGGLVLAAEPNNVSTSLVLNSITFDDPVENILAGVRLQLICERGKAALGEGNNSVGDIVPGLFAAAGLTDIAVYLNDKTNAFLPPYDTPEQRALLEERQDFDARDFWIWNRDDSFRYFLAGGRVAAEFDALWTSVNSGADRFEKAVAERTYSHAGAALNNLVAGRKADQPGM